ncbi:MAG: hypothetical protein R3D02_15410 [Hyphomicrobiales bacterium]
MQPQFDQLLDHIRQLEDELEDEFERRRDDFVSRLENGRVTFEAEVRRRHRELKARLAPYLLGVRPLVLVTAPVIYSLIVPFALLDLFVTVYQAACFPVYGIDKVSRRDFIVIDRHLLGYLNAIEKLNCVYCSYANGLVGYVREIAARTEQYWCPIKHARRVAGAHPRYPKFFDYGDAERYHDDLEEMRGAIAPADRRSGKG